MSIHNTIQKRRLAVITYQYDTATEDVIDYANTNTITLPKPSRLIALDQLIKGLKRMGIWAKLDVLSNFAYNDTNADEFSLIDLIRVSEMTAFGGMSYTSQGYEGNGVDGYIDTLYSGDTNAVNYLLNDAMRGAVVFSQATIGIKIIDALSTLGQQILLNENDNRQRINQTNANLNSAADLSGLGLKTLNRTSSTDVFLTSLSSQYNRTATSTSASTLTQLLFRGGTQYSDVGLSSYMTGASLTYAETQTFRGLYNEYLKQIGLTQFA